MTWPNSYRRKDLWRASWFTAMNSVITLTLTGVAGSMLLTSAFQQGAAQIAGVVISQAGSDSGRPVSHANVALSAGSRFAQQTTDNEGRFAFSDLHPGRYALRASKAGYLDSELGAFRSGESGTPVNVQPGEQISGLRVSLFRAGAISGVLRTAQGEPATDVPVAVRSLSVNRGVSRAALTRAISDRLGQYRVHGLSSGEYLVSAAPAQSGATGALPTFFPGTTDPDLAVKVTVAAGDERDRMDFSLAPPGRERLTGTVVDLRGSAVPGANIRVETPFDVLRQTSADASGNFVVLGLHAGRYSVTATRNERPTSVQPRSDPTWALLEERVNGWAQQEIEIPHGTADVTLRMHPPVTFSGSVRLIGSSSNAVPSGGTITLASLTRQQLPLTAAVDGGAFQIRGIVPGRYRLELSGPRDRPWILTSAEAAGRSLLAGPLQFDFSTGDLNGVVVSASTDLSGLTGVLSESTGGPAVDFWVAVVPADPSHWHSGDPRLVRTRPATNGEFVFDGIPAGEYLLAVFGDGASGDWQEVAFLSKLAQSGLKVVLRSGGRTVQHIRIGGAAGSDASHRRDVRPQTGPQRRR